MTMLSLAQFTSSPQLLPPRRPARGATADGRVLQLRTGTRTGAALFPAMIEEPRVGRIGKVLADNAQRLAANGADFAVKRRPLRGIERTGGLLRMNRGAPKNLVGHPVTNAGKAFLH